jgi:hypothetical protein
MRKVTALDIGLLAPCLWIGCSTTIVAQRSFALPVQGALSVGDRCWRIEECEHGTCQNGYCVGSGSREPTVLEKINETLEGESAEVLLAADAPAQPVEAREFKVGPESTQWLELQRPTGEYRPRSVPTEALRRISNVARGRGAAEGLGLGILVGTATGAIAGAVAGTWVRICFGDTLPGEQCPTSPRFLAFVGAIAGAGFGAAIGTLIGAGLGHRTTIEFESSQAAP